MAWRQNRDGDDVQQRRGGVPPEREEARALELTPPGSAERSRSDVTGYRMDRDEEPEARQGRFHRAAQLRLNTSALGEEPRPLEGREGELERWGGGWHGEQPWEAQRPLAQRDTSGDDAGQGSRTLDFEANDLTRSGFATSFAARERTLRMAAEEARTVERYRRGRGGGPAFTEGTRGLREEGFDRSLGQGGRRRRWEREPLLAEEIMTRGPRCVRRDAALSEAARLMRDENVGVVPVVDVQGRLEGLVTDRDLVVRAFTEQRTPEQFRVRDVMTTDVDAVTPDTRVEAVIELMGRKQVRRVPVVDREDRLLGIIAMADIANRADQDEELQRALERISSRRSFWSRL